MLPDYPSLKKEIAEVLNIILRKKVENYLVGLREVQKTRVFEGKRMVMKRKSGEEEESPLMSTEVKFEIGMDEIPKMSIVDLLGKLACSFTSPFNEAGFIREEFGRRSSNTPSEIPPGYPWETNRYGKR